MPNDCPYRLIRLTINGKTVWNMIAGHKPRFSTYQRVQQVVNLTREEFGTLSVEQAVELFREKGLECQKQDEGRLL